MELKKQYLKKPATPTDLENKLLEAAQILNKLRESSTNWQTHFGSYYKTEMQKWERKADKFLAENIVDVELEEQPKILID